MKDEIKNELVVPFTIIPNGILNDPLLSLKQKGMLCYLISLPKGWVVYKSELENHFTDGRESISNALEDLVEMGFVSKVENKKEQGKFSGFTYTVLPLRDNRDGFTATDNPQLINTNSNNTNKVNLNINAELKNSAEIDKEILPVKAKPLKEKKKKKNEIVIEGFTREQTLEIYSEFKKYFMDFYSKNLNAGDYFFESKNAPKVYSILKKILFKMKIMYPGTVFIPYDLISSANIFISTVYKSGDDFIKNNFNLSMIDSKFNDLYAKIKNKKHGNSGTSAREAESARKADRFKKR